MIFANSRYVNAVLAPAETSDHMSVMAVYPVRPNRRKRVTYTEHVIVDGDRMDRLAAQFYGDATQWWRIAQANPEIFYPEGDLPSGNILRIPSVQSLSTV